MPSTVEDDVLVDFVGNQEDVGTAQHSGQLAQVVFPQHRARRVVRAVDHQHAGARGDGVLHFLPVHGESLRIQGHMHGLGSCQVDGRLVTVVGRVQHDHFLARPHHRMDRIEDRLGGPAGHGDLGIGVHLGAVAAQRLVRDGLAQHRYAGHRCVLVMAGMHGSGQFVHQSLRHGEIGKALAQIDRAVFGGQLGHDGEDGGAYLGQLGFEGHWPFRDR